MPAAVKIVPPLRGSGSIFQLFPTVPLRFTVGYPVVAPPGLCCRHANNCPKPLSKRHQHSARAAVWCCIDRHPSQPGGKEQMAISRNKEEARSQESEETQNRKTFHHRGRRGTRRKTFFCHRFALISADLFATALPAFCANRRAWSRDGTACGTPPATACTRFGDGWDRRSS